MEANVSPRSIDIRLGVMLMCLLQHCMLLLIGYEVSMDGSSGCRHVLSLCSELSWQFCSDCSLFKA